MFELNNPIDLLNKKNDVLTVGEILIDMISKETGENFESDTYNKFFGGSPANIAMNLKKLGVNSLITSAVGKDGLGDFLINYVSAAGLNNRLIQQVDESTSMVMVTRSKSTPVPIFYRGADYHLAYTDELEEAVKSSKILHFSCWPISRQPARKTIENLIEIARENDLLICFDPNYHPMIWEKGEDGIGYVKSIIGKVDIIKPSEDDAERLFGKDTNENQIKKFIQLGAKLVIMTLGSEGALVSNGYETIKLKTMAQEVVDTTGAGDAFWSGFYAAVVEGNTIREALNIGLAVSAYKLKYVGAVINLPKLQFIKNIYNL